MTPDPFSAIEIESTRDRLVVPRRAAVQRTNTTSP